MDDGGFKISGPKLSPFFECTLLTTLPIPAWGPYGHVRVSRVDIGVSRVVCNASRIPLPAPTIFKDAQSAYYMFKWSLSRRTKTVNHPIIIKNLSWVVKHTHMSRYAIHCNPIRSACVCVHLHVKVCYRTCMTSTVQPASEAAQARHTFQRGPPQGSPYPG